MFYRPLSEVLKSMIDHPSIREERNILRIILQRYLVNGTVAVVSTIISLGIFGATSMSFIVYCDDVINVPSSFFFELGIRWFHISRCSEGRNTCICVGIPKIFETKTVVTLKCACLIFMSSWYAPYYEFFCFSCNRCLLICGMASGKYDGKLHEKITSKISRFESSAGSGGSTEEKSTDLMVGDASKADFLEWFRCITNW